MDDARLTPALRNNQWAAGVALAAKGDKLVVRAIWNGTVLAEAGDDEIELVEGNVYFPPASINREFIQDSPSHTRCYWKGKASYYDVVVEGQTNADAGWYYPKPSRLAKRLKDHVAFWHGVRVERA